MYCDCTVDPTFLVKSCHITVPPQDHRQTTLSFTIPQRKCRLGKLPQNRRMVHRDPFKQNKHLKQPAQS